MERSRLHLRSYVKWRRLTRIYNVIKQSGAESDGRGDRVRYITISLLEDMLFFTNFGTLERS